MRIIGIICAIIGLALLGVAVAQHLYYFANVDHAAVYFALLGLLALIPGAWLALKPGK